MRRSFIGWRSLRPAFTHWGYVGAGGDGNDQINVDAGCAFELMHAFALFHDDVMDDADSRRGQPTTHVVAAEEHAEKGWGGESRRFGEGVAILVGDLAFVYADQLLEEATPEAARIWNELRIELIRRSTVYFAEALPAVQAHHGIDDDTIPYSQTQLLIDAMEGRADFESFLYEGGGHHPLTIPESLPRVRAFLQAALFDEGA